MAYEKITAWSFFAQKNGEEGLRVKNMKTKDWLKFADELADVNLERQRSFHVKSFSKLLTFMANQVYHGKR